jgi:hypothetical protein
MAIEHSTPYNILIQIVQAAGYYNTFLNLKNPIVEIMPDCSQYEGRSFLEVIDTE